MSVLTGKTPLTEMQAVRLTKTAIERTYVPMARTAFHEAGGVWDALPKHQQAALSYLAYNTGNPAQFKTVLGKMAAQDYQGAAEALTLTYKDKNGQQRELARAATIIKSMMQSPKAFELLIAKGI
jgi:GH24 family phage-related lysozyme (muramidase)